MLEQTDGYLTLLHGGEGTFEEKRSTFIGYALPVQSEEEALAFIRKIKSKHYDARHNVYAYLLGQSVARYSDDGEPQGTAGIPILEVIKKCGITNACIVVTRYFGGILLGAGGLVRAYTAAAKAAVDDAQIAEYVRFSLLRIRLAYPDFQKFSAKLPALGAKVDAVDYADAVTVDFAVQAHEAEKVCREVFELFNGKSSANVVGERFDLLAK